MLTEHVLGATTVLGAEGRVTNRVDKTPCPRVAFILLGETHQGVNYNSLEGDKCIEKINQGKEDRAGCTFNFRMPWAGICFAFSPFRSLTDDCSV